MQKWLAFATSIEPGQPARLCQTCIPGQRRRHLNHKATTHTHMQLIVFCKGENKININLFPEKDSIKLFCYQYFDVNY